MRMKQKYNKIYIPAPFQFTTGGVELIHQFVDKINNLGGDAYIVYQDQGKIIDTETITPQYSSYNVKVTSVIEDTEDNFLMLPETLLEWANKFQHITLGCWWMSVDNRYEYKVCNWKDTLYHYRGTLYNRLVTTFHNFRFKIKNNNKNLKKLDNRIWHFYQSVYAQHHIYSLGFSKVVPLGDYINSAFNLNQKEQKRENIILYNPAKGYKYTKKIINSNPDLKFIPIKGMTREELVELMRKSKVYIDFGHFPGKDRLVRESILNGLSIITGTKGASFYYEDIPLPPDLKFKQINRNIPLISKMIRNLLNNPSEYKIYYSNYRNEILCEEKKFENQIKKFFFLE